MQWEQEFHGPNLGWLEEAYSEWLNDPESVSEFWRQRFARIGMQAGRGMRIAPDGWVPAGVAAYAKEIREFGHLAADFDPLRERPAKPEALQVRAYGLSSGMLEEMTGEAVGGPLAEDAASAREALKRLKDRYTGTTGFEFEHVRNKQERQWLEEAVESSSFRPPAAEIDEKVVLDRLVQVQVFEQFIHRVFPGKHRFSIEGLDMLVPMLDELVRLSLNARVQRFFIGMAHRGRLSVLAHILCEPYARILAEFKDPLGPLRSLDDLGWTGDVKYHRGASRVEAQDDPGSNMTVHMSPNPSHVEAINPVVMGMVRAAITLPVEGGEVALDRDRAVAVEIHGDAAFPGQGITAETLNMSRLDGYSIGGVLHLIANNQLGYTTEPGEARSTQYASDLAKGFNIPILHCNADDPIACLEAVRLAEAYRRRFMKDFVIDLVGYRRYGHNEGDEPSFTQPVLYQIIEEHPRVAEMLAERLRGSGRLEKGHLSELRDRYEREIREVYDTLDSQAEIAELAGLSDQPDSAQVETGIDPKRLLEVNERLLTLPEGFELHPKLGRFMNRRRAALEDERMVDWATAEQLAFATLLEDGIPIRLTGEDVIRGTFNQRHLAFYDYSSGEPYIPLQHLTPEQAPFEVHNSPLTESAVLAFEYGFDVESGRHLVLWEAQYGDFINNAQMVIDEFIVSAASKWRVRPSLVLLLPHGMEGAGPDHSSGRMERFLTLSTGMNLRVANPSSAGQYFHLLRQQGKLIEREPVPLIVFTPKSLLRARSTYSDLNSLENGSWRLVIDDAHPYPERVQRVLLCSGKIYHDLISHEVKQVDDRIAIIRIEQLTPFPGNDVETALGRYRDAEQVMWVQEEPANMGAWYYVRRWLRDELGVQLEYVGRPASASPAEGSAAWHAKNQHETIEHALSFDLDGSEREVVAHKEVG